MTAGQRIHQMIGVYILDGMWQSWEASVPPSELDLSPVQKAGFELLASEIVTLSLSAELRALSTRIEAKGWPTLKQNRDLCMERAREFLDGRDALFERYGVFSTLDSGAVAATVWPASSTPDLHSW